MKGLVFFRGAMSEIMLHLQRRVSSLFEAQGGNTTLWPHKLFPTCLRCAYLGLRKIFDNEKEKRQQKTQK